MIDRIFVFGMLPPLEFNSKPEISSKEVFPLFEMNLGKGTLKKVKVLKTWIDLLNIYLLPIEGKFDSRGNYSKSTLKELLASQEELPEYILDFFEKYDTDQKRFHHFGELIGEYFRIEEKNESGFLREFLAFEHSLRIVSGAFYAKRQGLSIARELQYEDMGDPIVAFCVAQSEGRGKFQFPYEFLDLEKRLQEAGSDPSKVREVFARYRYQFYGEFLLNYPFSTKALMAYLMQLWILEEYYGLNREEGLQILNQLVERDNVS